MTDKDIGWQGLDQLIHFYKKMFYDDSFALPNPHDFSDIERYYLKVVRRPVLICVVAAAHSLLLQAVAGAVSQISDSSGRSPTDVLEFLMELLKNNDNSSNEVQQCGG